MDVIYQTHFYVLKLCSRTTPPRVIFDVNAREVSLNQYLGTGPCLLNNLWNVLLRFRAHQFAFHADIQRFSGFSDFETMILMARSSAYTVDA